jgi:hypothetical protein
MLAKVLRVRRRQERALMMVEPPGELGRIRVFKIHDYIFIAVEQAIFPGLHGPMSHAAEPELGGSVEAFAVQAIKERGRGSSVKAAIMKTEPYTSHIELETPFLPGCEFYREQSS